MSIYVYNVRKSMSVGAKISTPCSAHDDCKADSALAAACGSATGGASTPVVIHALTYTCKYRQLPSQCWSSERRYAYPYDALMARMQNAWGSNRPAYVTILHEKFEDGLGVFKWTGDFEWVDCDKVPGEKVGLLRKDGKKWVVEPMDAVMVRVEKLLRVLASGPQPLSACAGALGCSEAFAKAVIEHLHYSGAGRVDTYCEHGREHVRLRAVEARAS